MTKNVQFANQKLMFLYTDFICEMYGSFIVLFEDELLEMIFPSQIKH